MSRLDNPKEISMLQDLLKKGTPAQWKPSPKVRQALRLQDSILAGKTPPSKLRFLDLEYNARTGLVFEVGMCDAMGQVTMDCLTRLSPAELTRTSRPIDKVSIRIAERHHRTVIKDHQCRQGTLNVHQIAKQLKAEGITPETIFVVWARNKSDLRLLSEWLEAEGYSGILPPDSTCVPVTNDFQINVRTSKLSNGKQFPTSLPIIFPVYLGTHHHLYGRNHQAIFDTLQLWLMNEAFKQLCLPPSDRDQDLLSKLGNLGKQQGSLDNY